MEDWEEDHQGLNVLPEVPLLSDTSSSPPATPHVSMNADTSARKSFSVVIINDVSIRKRRWEYENDNLYHKRRGEYENDNLYHKRRFDTKMTLGIRKRQFIS